jgi:hypothetical protein
MEKIPKIERLANVCSVLIMATMKKQSVLAVLVLAFCGSLDAAVFTFNDTGLIQAGNPNPLVTPSHLLSGLGSPIADLILTVNLNTRDALGEIVGKLYLGDLGSTPFFTSFSLSTSSATSVIDLSTAFSGKVPNDYWTLSLGDPSGAVNHSLVSWSLDITPVPEPVTFALGTFAALVVSSTVGSWLRRRSAIYLPKETEEAG